MPIVPAEPSRETLRQDIFNKNEIEFFSDRRVLLDIFDQARPRSVSGFLGLDVGQIEAGSELAVNQSLGSSHIDFDISAVQPLVSFSRTKKDGQRFHVIARSA